MIKILPIETPGLGDRTYLAHDGKVALVVDTHLSFALEVSGEIAAVFTGGSLLYGTTGRPDLLGPEHTDTLVRAQWRSAHRLATELPDETAVYPTHGFGSFCSASEATGQASTIGQEKRTNTALTADEQTYVEELLAGLDAFPAYYAHMGPANSAGPGKPDLTAPAAAEPGELRRRIEAGEWVVDLRGRTAFAAGHLAGTLNFGLDGQFLTYLGWLIPWGTPVTLLGETADDVAVAQRELVRIGIDRPAAMATGAPQDWAGGEPLVSYERATFADLKAALESEAEAGVLDVRRDQERGGAHVAGSVHIPIHEVLHRLDEIPSGRVWVYCASGYRAAAVTALLHARGRDVVHIDDAFGNACTAGLCATGLEVAAV
jgi:hydroxyacylglutathione hydrolase